MHENGVAQAARAEIDVAENEAEQESVEELVEVHVEQAEHQRGKHDGGAFAVAGAAVDELLAEDKFLKQRRENDGGQNLDPAKLGEHGVDRIGRSAAGKQRRKRVSDQAAAEQQRKADEKQRPVILRTELCRCVRSGRDRPQNEKAGRIRDGIERQNAEKRADGGALGQNAGGREERDDEGQDELHQKRDERHGKKAEAEAVEITLRREKRGLGVHGLVPPLSGAGRAACADQSAR